MTGWQASRPHPAAELAAGPVGGLIAGLIAPRALVPVATAAAVTTVYNLLNSDRKTVARLLVSRPSLAGPGQQGPLPPRFEVTGVRGYQGQARRAARLVEAVPGLRAASEPLLADALRARGRRPGDYSNKVDARITPDMPAVRRRGGRSCCACSTPSTSTPRACWPTSTPSTCMTCG